MSTSAGGYKIAVIGSDLLATGMKLSGVVKSFSPETGAQAEATMRDLMQKEDVGIIVVTSRILKMIRDRRLQEAVTSSIMPLIVEIPDYGEQEQQVDELRRLIIRAIGIDIEKTR